MHVDAIVAEVLQRLNRPRFEKPMYAMDLETRVQVRFIVQQLQPDVPSWLVIS